MPCSDQIVGHRATAETIYHTDALIVWMTLRPRHIWVFPARANGDSRPDPGLLIEWQKRHGQWWAQ